MTEQNEIITPVFKNKASGASPESKAIWPADHLFRWLTTG